MQQQVTTTVTLIFDCQEGLSAEDHKARIEEDIGRLYDADSNTGVTCTGFEVERVQEVPHSRTHLVCATCGSLDVLCDAYAQWDVTQGAWVLHSTYNDTRCETCDDSRQLEEINEATDLEIQAFAMVNDADGSRQAQAGEKPAFYDVMVTTHPTKDGTIHALHEMDNLSRSQLEKCVAIMSTTYPLAPVSYHFREVDQ